MTALESFDVHPQARLLAASKHQPRTVRQVPMPAAEDLRQSFSHLSFYKSQPPEVSTGQTVRFVGSLTPSTTQKLKDKSNRTHGNTGCTQEAVRLALCCPPHPANMPASQSTPAMRQSVGVSGRGRHLYVTSREIQRGRRHTPRGYSGRLPEKGAPSRTCRLREVQRQSIYRGGGRGRQ